MFIKLIAKGDNLKFNQIHKGEERQKKNKQIRKGLMFKKLKKRIKTFYGEEYVKNHGLAVKSTEVDPISEREVNWDLSAFKSTGSPYSNKADKAWSKKSRKKEKQNWKRNLDY